MFEGGVGALGFGVCLHTYIHTQTNETDRPERMKEGMITHSPTDPRTTTHRPHSTTHFIHPARFALCAAFTFRHWRRSSTRWLRCKVDARRAMLVLRRHRACTCFSRMRLRPGWPHAWQRCVTPLEVQHSMRRRRRPLQRRRQPRARGADTQSGPQRCDPGGFGQTAADGHYNLCARATTTSTSVVSTARPGRGGGGGGWLPKLRL